MTEVATPPVPVAAGTLGRLGNVPAMVRNELASMPAERQDEFLDQYKRHQRNMILGYVLWFIGGWHLAYTRRWGLQVLFILTAGGVLVWWVVEAFLCKRRIDTFNRELAMETLRNLKAIRG